MLTEEKKQILNQIVLNFSKEEILWASGYLSGLAANDNEKKSIENLTILYISETGNAKFLATELVKKLKAQGTAAKLKSIEQYRIADFAKEKKLILITSTHGEGEIPQAGKNFYEYLAQNNLDLSTLNFWIIALGDHNYPKFCEAGKIVESQLVLLKAKKLAERIDLDLDFENSIKQIFEKISEIFGEGKKINAPIKIISSQTNFEGEIISNTNLNDLGSGKETRHIEIAVEDEINYEPGDSIGIKLGDETPRLYSIASAKGEHGNEVHLTVSVARHLDKNGNQAEGLVSGYLSRLRSGEKINFYLSRNRNFKLPADDKNIIMIGAGTGIAPFRSFLAERNSRGSSGKNWLFFGERNFQTDFLYQTELQDYLTSELLTKLDVAFSRDQEEKIYVQHRLQEKSDEIFKWLENGAHLYVCGDKENMARDVENTLLTIFQNHQKPAEKYLQNLTREGRYLKDVY